MAQFLSFGLLVQQIFLFSSKHRAENILIPCLGGRPGFVFSTVIHRHILLEGCFHLHIISGLMSYVTWSSLL